MPLVPFSPPPGLNSDDTTFKAEGAWADGSNVRFLSGAPQVIGGWLTTGMPLTTGICKSMAVARTADGSEWVVFGADAKLWYGAGISTMNDITPVGLGSSISRWSLQGWGSQLLACPVAGTLYLKADLTTGDVATEVTQAPDQISWMLVTNERQVLALGCNEEVSGTFNPMCIRGCDIEDYTDWTTTATNNAFEHILEGQGKIVSARLIGSYVAVWTNTGLYLGQFIGDPGQTYSFDRVDEGCGLIAAAAVTVHDGVAYWVSPDFRLFSWAPGGQPAVIPCPINEDFRDNFRKGFVVFTMVTAVTHYNEIWIHYADSRDASSSTKATRYIAYCISESAAAGRPVWFRGAMTLSAVIEGRLSLPSHDAGAYLTANGVTVFIQGHGNTANSAAMDWHIQSADQTLSNSQRRMMIRGIIPDFEDQVGDVSLTLYVRDRPQSSATTKGPHTLTTATTKKDFRASGKLTAVKFSGGSASGSYMRLGKPLFDMVPTGLR